MLLEIWELSVDIYSARGLSVSPNKATIALLTKIKNLNVLCFQLSEEVKYLILENKLLWNKDVEAQ